MMSSTDSTGEGVLVAGSANMDLIIPIDSLPNPGETIVASEMNPQNTCSGGKGANQAVSCGRLGALTHFIGRLGSDSNGLKLLRDLSDNNVHVNLCQKIENKSTGMGIVLLQKDSGIGSCIVVGGANDAWELNSLQETITGVLEETSSKIACIMLQMEVPQPVNDIIAKAAMKANIPIFQDVGGQLRDLPSNYLKLCTYLSPNLSELKRLTKMPVDTEEEILAAVRYLQSIGARNVLVTLGSNGSLLVTENSSQIIRQPAIPVDAVVDETGAGDNFRAAFVVSHFIDKKSLADSLEFASVAGSISVTRLGAMPSSGTREECVEKLIQIRGGGVVTDEEPDLMDCPFQFASRLNSMKDRPDLWQSNHSEEKSWTVFDLIERQSHIEGLDLIDFNYPQHIPASDTIDPLLRTQLMEALSRAKLKCGAICLRFPKEMRLGAFTNPDETVRRRAIELTKQACRWAEALDTNEVVVWSAFDGYDYSLQVNYDELLDQVVTAFQEICDEYPMVKISFEYKPTDENTRFFIVPSAGSAVLLMKEIDRDNFGLTVDFGHCLMAGENPAQSLAIMSKSGGGKVFGVQLGDGYGRLGAEDGLMFGSVHWLASLEFVLWLIKTNYSGHIYFDTFPRNEDPIKECEQ